MHEYQRLGLKFGLDRYKLFNNLKSLFESIDFYYKMILCNGFELDILDTMICPLYLATIQSQYNNSADSIPFSNLSVKKKISMFPGRVIERMRYFIEIRSSKKIANFNNNSQKGDIIFVDVEPEDEQVILSTTTYGDQDYCSAMM